MAGLLTRRSVSKRLPENLSDIVLAPFKGDSQLRDSRGLSPRSHFNRLSNRDSLCDNLSRCKGTKNNEHTYKKTEKVTASNDFFYFLWTWWESNPRPHKETMRFLHAYSRLHFRDATRPGPPIAPLSPKTSSRHRGLPQLFPIFLRRLSLRFGTTPLERRLVSSPGEEIKL